MILTLMNFFLNIWKKNLFIAENKIIPFLFVLKTSVCGTGMLVLRRWQPRFYLGFNSVEKTGARRWVGLDNFAKIYPAVTKKTNPCVFRLSAILTENVDPDALQKAAQVAIKRFPTMSVKLKKGLFWAYLYENNNPLEVKEESSYPCAPIMGDKENNEYLFKIMYFGSRITLECFHALTDGMGAMEFLKSLVFQYLLLVGKDVHDDGMILLPESTPEKQEWEDGCLRYYQKYEKKPKFETRKAQSIQGTVLEDRGMNVIHGVIPVLPLNQYAREHKTTVTGYLVTVFAKAILSSPSQQNQAKNCHPVQIGIPVNLRGIFPSRTLRNFVSQINVSIPTESGLSFEELTESVTTQIKNTITKENLSDRINTFVGYEKMFAGRFIPWFLKKGMIGFVSKRAAKTTTATLANLGNVKLPESMAKYIDMIEAVPAHKEAASINCGICSVDGKLNIAFSSNITEADVIRNFFDLISGQTGLEIKLYSNGWIESNAQSVSGQDFYPLYTTSEIFN